MTSPSLFETCSPKTPWARCACVGLMATATFGCGVNSGFLHDRTSDQTIHQMAISSERYVRTVVGESSVPSLLCALPLGGRLYLNAMHDLNAFAKLQANEALKNIRTDDDLSCFIFVGARSLTISADVYEVTPLGGAEAPSVKDVPPAKVNAVPLGIPRPVPDAREHDCLDTNSCSSGYHCAFTSGAGMGTCRPVLPTTPAGP
jgi:hypothetical protein